MVQWQFLFAAIDPIVNSCRGQAGRRIASDRIYLAVHVKFDIGQRSDAVDQILRHRLLKRAPDDEVQLCDQRREKHPLQAPAIVGRPLTPRRLSAYWKSVE